MLDLQKNEDQHYIIGRQDTLHEVMNSGPKNYKALNVPDCLWNCKLNDIFVNNLIASLQREESVYACFRIQSASLEEALKTDLQRNVSCNNTSQFSSELCAIFKNIRKIHMYKNDTLNDILILELTCLEREGFDYSEIVKGVCGA